METKQFRIHNTAITIKNKTILSTEKKAELQIGDHLELISRGSLAFALRMVIFARRLGPLERRSSLSNIKPFFEI